MNYEESQAGFRLRCILSRFENLVNYEESQAGAATAGNYGAFENLVNYEERQTNEALGYDCNKDKWIYIYRNGIIYDKRSFLQR